MAISDTISDLLTQRGSGQFQPFKTDNLSRRQEGESAFAKLTQRQRDNIIDAKAARNNDAETRSTQPKAISSDSKQDSNKEQSDKAIPFTKIIPTDNLPTGMALRAKNDKEENDPLQLLLDLFNVDQIPIIPNSTPIIIEPEIVNETIEPGNIVSLADNDSTLVSLHLNNLQSLNLLKPSEDKIEQQTLPIALPVNDGQQELLLHHEEFKQELQAQKELNPTMDNAKVIIEQMQKLTVVPIAESKSQIQTVENQVLNSNITQTQNAVAVNPNLPSNNNQTGQDASKKSKNIAQITQISETQSQEDFQLNAPEVEPILEMSEVSTETESDSKQDSRLSFADGLLGKSLLEEHGSENQNLTLPADFKIQLRKYAPLQPIAAPISSENVVNQVKFKIEQAVLSGDQKLTVQLHPAELGKVDISVEIPSSGQAKLSIGADRVGTLEILKQGAEQLKEILHQIGIKADVPQFSLNDSNKQSFYRPEQQYSSSQQHKSLEILPEERVTIQYILGSDKIDIRV